MHSVFVFGQVIEGFDRNSDILKDFNSVLICHYRPAYAGLNSSGNSRRVFTLQMDARPKGIPSGLSLEWQTANNDSYSII